MIGRAAWFARIGALAALATFWGASGAQAQGVGFQGGGGIDPEHFYAGSHFEWRLADRIYFRPAISGGFAENLRLAAIDVDFLYKFPLEGTQWSIYQGGGPAVNIYRIFGRNDVQGGLNVIFGFAHERGFFTEFRVGSSGSPNLRFGVGYTVR